MVFLVLRFGLQLGIWIHDSRGLSLPKSGVVGLVLFSTVLRIELLADAPLLVNLLCAGSSCCLSEFLLVIFLS